MLVSCNLFCEFVHFDDWDAAEEKKRKEELSDLDFVVTGQKQTVNVNFASKMILWLAYCDVWNTVYTSIVVTMTMVLQHIK